MRSALRLLLIAAALLLAMLAVSSCEDDSSHITSPFGEKDEEVVEGDVGSISGTTIAVDGSLERAVRVVASSSLDPALADTGYSDTSGRFFLTGLAEDRDVVAFEKTPQLFNRNYRRLQVVLGAEIHFPDVMLLPVQRGGVFYASDGGEAAVGGFGSGATFADSSFVAPDSTVYVERVAPYMAVTTIGEAHFAAAFPGEFHGDRTDGSEVPLDAVGVIWNFVDSQAGGLDLAPGKSVVYRLGVDPAGGATLPPVAQVWLLDQATARWREVGESPLVDGVYEAEVASLGPVCWAVPSVDQCAVTGVVQDASGDPLANVTVSCVDLSGDTRGATLSQADGTFSLTIARKGPAMVTAYFGSIAGEGVAIDPDLGCPVVIDEPLTITLPDYSVAVAWDPGYGDLDGHLVIRDEEEQVNFLVDYVRTGSLDQAPFTALTLDIREGGDPEIISGRRWYDGTTEYWVHDYQNKETALLRDSGAVVDLTINDETWTFAVADVAYDAAESDTSGWWHVFDVVISGTEVVVDTVQSFEPMPVR